MLLNDAALEQTLDKGTSVRFPSAISLALSSPSCLTSNTKCARIFL